ncbi:hypothetical protein SLEP1_g44741 [Rubroshorea leprosula]|uniref:ABC transporter domain-containing protein n=1 Tax=Rubroshorea leprosula TaxID=152421 RepID=A0AAV5LID6_9ROSI|nr:hypothetical protein SLEP1_g44741 [Rubroshorea leprosula]
MWVHVDSQRNHDGAAFDEALVGSGLVEAVDDGTNDIARGVPVSYLVPLRNPDLGSSRNPDLGSPIPTLYWREAEKRWRIGRKKKEEGERDGGGGWWRREIREIQPGVAIERTVIYREWAARMYSVLPYALAQIFVDEVMELVELDNLKHAIVGLPGIMGLSTEQKMRLTIAVELVANPSIIFMDEPTSGLDARAAAIVMRTVRNMVDTGKTVVCTIHQPSIDIFEAFDELLLMKRGQVIYSGPLGRNSHKIIEYFEAIPGIPKIKDKYNPGKWMLGVSSIAAEVRLGMDFAEYYKSSSLYQRSKALVKELSTPPPGAKDLYFPTQYSQSSRGQFKSCVWKQWWTYWRSLSCNPCRYSLTLLSAFIVGVGVVVFKLQKESSTDLMMEIEAEHTAVILFGISKFVTVQPEVAIERTMSS